MNGKAIIFSGIAVFAGVLGALEADHFMNHHPVSAAANTIALLPETPPSSPAIPADYQQGSGGMLDFRVAAKKVVPSVVSVDRYERVAQDFFDDTGRITETGTGSGVIVSKDGVIITNNHVVADQQGHVVPEVKVRLNDKRSFTAKVIGNDPRADIAVLKIDAPNLTPIDMGVSGSLEVGQWVMAVGNPLGFDDTVSVGVVSSLKRDLPVGEGGLVNAIQTDAAINPGNSGGALCDQHGNLVGINSAIASGNGGSVGIGFAIPVDRVKTVVNDIIKYGHARYPGLGVAYRREWTGALGDPENRQYLAQVTGGQNVPTHGIIAMSASGPAADAGVKQYDILLSIDDTFTDSEFDINKALASKKPGDTVRIKWWSKGETKSADIKLQEIGGPVQ